MATSLAVQNQHNKKGGSVRTVCFVKKFDVFIPDLIEATNNVLDRLDNSRLTDVKDWINK